MNVETLAQQHHLGSLVSAHSWYKPIYRMNLYLLLFFAPFVLLATALIIGIPIGILYVFFFVSVTQRLSSSKNIFYVYEQGVVDNRKHKPVVVRYDEIVQLYFWNRLDIAPFFIKVHREEYKVKLINGQTYQFIQTINGIREIGDYLQTQILNLQFSQAIAKLQHNEQIDFSVVKMDKNGIYRGKKFLPWQDLEVAQIESTKAAKNVYVHLVIREKGHRYPWASFARERFANLALFLALVQSIQQEPSTPPENTLPISLSSSGLG